MILRLFYASLILISVGFIILLIEFIISEIKRIKQEKIDKLISENKLEDAVKIILELKKKSPGNAHLCYSLAYLYWKEEKINEAIDQLKIALYLKGNKQISALSDFLLGYINFYSLGNKTEAENCLVKAIKLNPKLIHAYNTVGVVYTSDNEYEKAAKMFEKVIKYAKKKDKENISNAYNNLGIIDIKKGNYESAISNFKKALEIMPYNIDLNINLGNAYGIRMDYSEAYQYFKKAEDIESNNKFIKYWIGCLHFLEGEYDNSIKKFKEAIELDKNFSFAYLQMAFAYKKLGDEQESRKLWEHACLLNPQINSTKISMNEKGGLK